MEARWPAENTIRPMPTTHRLWWPLIGALALAAMVSGHALELWLENSRVLGDGRASYAHSLQTFAIEAALVLLVCALALIAGHFLSRSRRVGINTDNLLPALDAVVRLGAVRSVLILVSVQFAALVMVELLEQRGSGFNGGLSAIVGPGHATAIIVHAVVGLVFALALNRVARFVCAETRALVYALSTFLRRATSRAAFTPATRLPLRLLASGRKPPLLALGLANRPPPATSTIAA
jgi:hypothetical protein